MDWSPLNRFRLRGPTGLFILPAFAVTAAERTGISLEDLLNPAVAARLLSVDNLAKCFILKESFPAWFEGGERLEVEGALANCFSPAEKQLYTLVDAWHRKATALPPGLPLADQNVNAEQLISTAYALRTNESLRSEFAREYILQSEKPVVDEKSLEGISFRALPKFGVAVIVAPRGPYTAEVRSMFLKALFRTLMQTHSIEELAGTTLFGQYLGCLSDGK